MSATSRTNKKTKESAESQVDKWAKGVVLILSIPDDWLIDKGKTGNQLSVSGEGDYEGITNAFHWMLGGDELVSLAQALREC